MSEPTDTNDPAPLRILSCSNPGRHDDSAPPDAPDDADERVKDNASEFEIASLSLNTAPDDPGGDDSDSDDEERDVESAAEDAPSGKTGESDPASFVDKRIALFGRFGSMSHREAANVLQSFQAVVVDLPRRSSSSPAKKSVDSGDTSADRLTVDLVVIGADQPPLSQGELLPPGVIDAAARGELEIIHETELWQRLGLFDVGRSAQRYYTPVMLADLLGVSVRVVRRWQRLGLITPVTTLHKLPYFDYTEVATAKRLAGWMSAGASPAAIERRLVDLIQVLPNIRRPLDQLSILVEGKHILLRQGDGLVEPGGQMRFDFDALETDAEPARDVLAFEPPDQPPMLRSVAPAEHDPILEAAYQAEDEDDLETAIDLYHTILARDGARAEICFQIGELLYRMNFLIAARERYYSAIEIDPEFVEARASLGAVLAELGQLELAVAALRGALSMHEDYADVHYTLAKTLDRLGDDLQALQHWQRIVQLAPDSPWAAEARERLGI
ncbi:Tetratricopeptide repeat protein [Stieleria maiorica]|uniref:Tetratricopeptide repeat protein n=1 Tax=Stieleria maiorica TaxID=2795974 RepID=A0A5B9MN04_9BACT|nr:MerR family transcriptional regulator [Stieleria maiorica]QEG01035.1 Tetratricopeptide repeat protein [Stieleria maiorica]